MPDLYTTMHAASVTDSIAPVLIITGIMLQAGADALASVKLAAILLFLLFAGTNCFEYRRARPCYPARKRLQWPLHDKD